MFGKIVAISTVKHLSWNYASFQQPSVQEWYSLSTSGQTQSIFKRNTADFHGDGYFLQNAGTSKDLRIALKVCVMLTLSTVVFKLILRILRYFYLTPLLYKSTFFTLLFPEVPTDIVGVIFKMTFSSIRTATTINS